MLREAQLQGRTILLNAGEFHSDYRQDFMNALSDDEVNLISVFLHERGHCLGLPDDTAAGQSGMNPNYVAQRINQTVLPTAVDFAHFVDSLRPSVSGTRPGFFNVKNCAGLTVKGRKRAFIDFARSPGRGMDGAKCGHLFGWNKDACIKRRYVTVRWSQ